MARKTSEKLERDASGRLLPGQESLNPNGRPKGKTIKEQIRDWLDENPEDMRAFVQHFVKKNRELAFQMLEGRPAQQLQGDPDKPLVVTIPKVVADSFKINESNDKTSGSDT